jgi:acetyl-CoA carboxylase biotin carboxyl carrier protein
MPLSEDDIRKILRLIDESEVDELRVETEAFSLYVLRGDAAPTGVEAEPEPAAAEATSLSRAHTEDVTTADAPAEDAATDVLTISAPLLGTFYRAQAPGAPPFVAVGTRVESDTVVCLIEVMKMMNSVPAGVAGTIVEVCAENAQLVESGAPLFQVRPER